MRKLLLLIISTLSTLNYLTAQTEFSRENATQILQHLSVDIGPRTMGSPAERQALNYAVGKFKENGCDTSYIMKIDRYSKGNTLSGVAVGIKRGLTKRIIVIGGHIDSAEPEIPGADDDGSGSAVVIEASRVFGKRQMQSTLVFCCFGGEEQGLIGSKHFAADFPDIDSVAMMLEVDMANGLGTLDILPDAHKSLSAPNWLIEAAVEEYNKLGYSHLRYSTHFNSLNFSLPSGPGSDHEPFLQKGIPAIAFISDVSYPIHTPRDNFENFDPAGLKRSGDLIVNLVQRFDGGVPSNQLQSSWLILFLGIPIFIPLWGLWIFLILVFSIVVFAFIQVRKSREPKDSPERIRWSGIKMFLFSIIMVICGWYSSDLIGWIKGSRYPWRSSIDWYYLLAAIAGAIGWWLVLRISLKLKLSRCPYVHFKRAVIILVILLLGLLSINIKLIVEPAVALLFISLALLVKKPVLKILFAALSPWWMLRLIFSEWSEAIFQLGTRGELSSTIELIANITLILFFSIWILPFGFGYTAIIRDSDILNALVRKLRSKRTLVILTISFISLGGYLSVILQYNSYVYRNTTIEEEYDMNSNTKTVKLTSSDYLSNQHITLNGLDTIVSGKIFSYKINPVSGFDTSWVIINRNVQTQRYGDTTHYDTELQLLTKFRPYTISISYSVIGKELNAFDTPWQFRTVKVEKNIYFYSFPDSILTIPVKFSTIGSDSVKEKIEILFDKLAYPVSVKEKMVDMIPRTKYTTSYYFTR